MLKKEVSMKIKLLLVVLCIMVCSISANAAITVDQSTSREYVVNSGYSETTSDAVTVVKNRSQGLEYYTPAEQRYRNSNGIFKFFRNLFNYTDPAADDYSFFHHDVEPAPAYTDL